MAKIKFMIGATPYPRIAVGSLLFALAGLFLIGAITYTQPIRASEPAPPGTVRFAVIGDYGQAGPAESAVSALVHSWTPDFIVTVGDNSYYTITSTQTITEAIDANIGQYYQDFIYPYTGIYGPGATSNKFYPSMGNHDWSGSSNPRPYVDYFTLPNNERYYDIVQGPVHFFMLDSDNREPDGNTVTSTQAIWLQNRLAASTAPWKLVILHHAPYSSIASTPALRWPYQQWGASAVLAGHIHSYERFDFSGFPYFVDGLGGAGITPANFNPLPGSVVRYKGDHGAMLVEGDANVMTYRFYTRTGLLIDTYTMEAAVASPTATATAIATATATSTATATATSIPILTNTATRTATSTATRTSTPTSTLTPVLPTATRTFTPQPTQTPGGATATNQPTNTRTSTATATATSSSTPTPVVPSATATGTPIPSTATIMGTSTVSLASPTSTSGPPTATTSTPTETLVATSTWTSVATTATTTVAPAATPCAIQFVDVPADSTFYPFVRCLACRGIISGYSDGSFRPNNLVTRGQLAKIVSNAAGFTESPDPQIFEDVPSANTFYEWINRLARRRYMSGYPCGGQGEPCGGGNMPYFRPFANATRGQTSKIVANTAGYSEPPTGQSFEDVPPSHTFYMEIQRLATRNIMGGYPCGGVGEPCLSNKPYFRPANNVTRGQSAKIVANTFYPNCQTLVR